MLPSGVTMRVTLDGVVQRLGRPDQTATATGVTARQDSDVAVRRLSARERSR